MTIKDKLIKEYPLTKKIEFPCECFEIDKRKYLVFLNEIIESKNIEEILNYLEEKSNNSNFTSFKTIIVIGKTKRKIQEEGISLF